MLQSTGNHDFYQSAYNNSENIDKDKKHKS